MATDPYCRLLTRIRNANQETRTRLSMPTSRMKEEIARILKQEGYIEEYRVVAAEPVASLVIDLKFSRDRRRVISGIKRVSTPGRRIYARRRPAPEGSRGLGIDLSMFTGGITGREAAGARHRRRSDRVRVASLSCEPNREEGPSRSPPASPSTCRRRGTPSHRSARDARAARACTDADRAGGRSPDRLAPHRARRRPRAARPDADVAREHGRRSHEGVREAPGDPGRRLRARLSRARTSSSRSVTRTRSRSLPGRESASTFPSPPRWSSRAPTSSSWARRRPRYARFAPRSRTRARASVTATSMSAARWEREPDHGHADETRGAPAPSSPGSRQDRGYRRAAEARRVPLEPWDLRAARRRHAGRDLGVRRLARQEAGRGEQGVPGARGRQGSAAAGKAAGVSRCVFDRGGYLFHGRVQALAEGAREGGLEF